MDDVTNSLSSAPPSDKSSEEEDEKEEEEEEKVCVAVIVLVYHVRAEAVMLKLITYWKAYYVKLLEQWQNKAKANKLLR